MIILDSITELRKNLLRSKINGAKIALVPTMGSLHSGHLKLIQEAREKGDIVVASIFVNPVQFNDQTDFVNYPRNFERDKDLLEKENCDIIFAPETDHIFDGDDFLQIELGRPAQILEGHFRPGHFNGVALIVSKLFNIVQPDIAFFGQKDLQQLFLIKKLVHDLNFPVEVISVPTLRSDTGLALSSRNRRLSKSGLKDAEVIFQSLRKAGEVYEQTKDPIESKNVALGLLKNSRAILEYFECVRLDKFEMLDQKGYGGDAAFCVSAFVEDVRLIDNIIIKG